MPYSVKQLLEDNPSPVSITQSDSVADALRLMAEHDYSQLPVVDDENRPIGLVTPGGVLRGLRNFNLTIDELNIREAMAKPSKFSQDDNLFDLLQQLQAHGAVLIIDATSKLVGIVTNYDTTDYFRERSENIMLVEDIETLIKEFILAAHEGKDGNVDEKALAKSVEKAAYYPDIKKPHKPKQFVDLSLSEYISLLLLQNLWVRYESSFNMPSKNVRNLLENVRKTRNELAHFRDDISKDQSNQLRFCSTWLGRCWEAYQQTKTVETNAAIVTVNTTTLPPVEEPDFATHGTAIEEEATPTDSRYAPLANHLATLPTAREQIDLTFSDVERIIGGELPASARKHQAWWANDTNNSSKHSVLWLEAGWRRNRLNMTNETVSFSRIKGREQAYISFYSTLCARLSSKSDFELHSHSPSGAGWHTWQSISPKPIMAWFNWSFSRGARFRIELYLTALYNQSDSEQADSASANAAKLVFDQIHAQKAQIEAQTGALAWERLDGRKASRIALYHPGSITDEAETLDALQEWVVANSILFYKAIEPIGQAAINQLVGTDQPA